MRSACYFNRFKGFPLKSQAFLVHLACDLATTSAALTTITTCVTTTGATAAKTASCRATTARAAASRTWATDQACFEGFLAIFFALTLNGVTVCTDVADRGLHGIGLRRTLWGFAATAALGSHQTLWAAALFSRTRCRRTWANAVATAAAVGALTAVMA
jgi:hypothetical protein